MSSATSAKDHPQVTDSMLISRIRGGDEDALAALHDRYAQVVYSVALRVLGDTTQAEDILQEIFCNCGESRRPSIPIAAALARGLRSLRAIARSINCGRG